MGLLVWLLFIQLKGCLKFIKLATQKHSHFSFTFPIKIAIRVKQTLTITASNALSLPKLQAIQASSCNGTCQLA